MRSLENTLALWVSGFLSSEDVVAWAGKEVARLREPPMELLDLLTDGPKACLKREQIDFPPRARLLSYIEAFSIKALTLDVESDESVWEFADWAARSSIGQDLSDPLVQLGHEVDQYFEEPQDRNGGTTVIRQALPSLIDRCKLIAAPYAETEA